MASKGCPICRSPFREEIEKRLQAKESLRAISSWLLASKDTSVAISSLSDHSRVHMSLAAEFAKQLLSQPTTRVSPSLKDTEPLPSEEALPPLEALALVQNKSITLLESLEAQMKDTGITPPQVTLWNGALRMAGAAAKARQELIYGKKITLTGNVSVVRPELKALSLEELKAKRDELRRKQQAESDGHVH